MINHPNRNKRAQKQPSYYLDPLPLSPETKPNVALEVLVRTMGDTWGAAKIMQDGGIEFWRMGKKVGKFDSFNAIYAECDKFL